ncbi:MAG: acylphosphatase [Rhodospirillales bacterium]|nr:acylphosphatase [Rhodospirillales bacterium]
MSQSAVRVRIEGRVQGVWFRAWTAQEATARGLDGWVRNRADGSVEALFAGPIAAVDEMLAACRRGPPMAAVSGVETAPAAAPADSGFHFLPTA